MQSSLERILRTRWRPVGAVALIFAAIAAVVILRAPREFIAHGSFLPQVSDASRSRLSGLAAQFGINVPSGDRGQSPDFFGELVQSRTILDRAIAADTTAASAGLGVELARLLNIDDSEPDVRHDKLLDELERRLLVTVGLRTAIISIDVRAPSRSAAAMLVAGLIAQVNHFVVASKRSQAGEEGLFAEQRLDSANGELRRAEDSLVAFSEANRTLGSPRLQVDRERLQRSIEFRQQVVTTIAQLYEQARIDAQRGTPSIVVIDAPAARANPVSRHLISTIGIAGLLGAACALLGLAVIDGRRPHQQSA